MSSKLFIYGRFCCIIGVWILHCFSQWFLFRWTVMKTEFDAYDSGIPWMEVMILLPMGLIQVLCSRVVDICSTGQMLFTWVIMAILPFLFQLESVSWLVAQQFFYGCGAALIIPTTSKFFASVYTDEVLNLVFCVLKLSTTVVKIFARISDISYSGMEAPQKLWMVTVGGTTFLSLLTLMMLDKKDRLWTPPVNDGVWKSNFVIRSALYIMLLKFTEEMVMHNQIMRTLIPHIRGSQISADLLIGLSAFLGGLILYFVCNDNRVVNYFYKPHLYCCALLAISITLVKLRVMDVGISLMVLGLQLHTPAIFLSGPVALRIGGSSGATVMGIIHGSGLLGQAIALVVLYFIPKFMVPYTVVTSLYMCTIFLRKLHNCNNKYMDTVCSDIV